MHGIMLMRDFNAWRINIGQCYSISTRKYTKTTRIKICTKQTNSYVEAVTHYHSHEQTACNRVWYESNFAERSRTSWTQGATPRQYLWRWLRQPSHSSATVSLMTQITTRTRRIFTRKLQRVHHSNRPSFESLHHNFEIFRAWATNTKINK